MEPTEAHWGSFDASEDSDIMAQFFGGISFTNDTQQDYNLSIPSMYWSDHDTVSSYYCSSDANSSLYYWPQGGGSNSCFNTSHLASNPSDIENYYLNIPSAIPSRNGNSFIPMDLYMGDHEESKITELLLEDPTCFIEETSNGGSGESNGKSLELISLPDHQKSLPKRRGMAMPELGKANVHDKEKKTDGSPQKKVRASVDDQKNGKSVQSKKSQKNTKNNRCEDGNADMIRQTSSSYSSEDDASSASQENNDIGASSRSKGSTAVNSNTKTRAGRGSATDPQSLYARKRRERINERLRILQNLVPNGTKVDISTMLEEAVRYVKFLQLQIKLLSSDDLWMYAPIAYNGMDIGLDINISPRQ